MECRDLLWSLLHDFGLGFGDDEEGFGDVCRRVSRGMRGLEDRSTALDVRVIMVLLRTFQVRSRIDFWTEPSDVQENCKIPELVQEWDVITDNQMHETAVNIAETETGVMIQLFPEKDMDGQFTNQCLCEIHLTSEEAKQLGTWLVGKGRMGGQRGSLLSEGRLK